MWCAWKTPSVNPVLEIFSVWMPLISKEVNKYHRGVMDSGGKLLHVCCPVHSGDGSFWMCSLMVLSIFKTSNS